MFETSQKQRTTSWLQNSGYGMARQIQHVGKDFCVRMPFRLSWRSSNQQSLEVQLCEFFNICADSDSTRHEALLKLVSQPPEKFQSLPAMCPVVLRSEVQADSELHWRGITDDPLIALSVLCRVGERLFCRDREPWFDPSVCSKTAHLILPPNWRPQS